MAIDGQVQAAGAARGQPLQFPFGGAHARQHFVGQRQHAQARRGQAGRPGAAVQQRRAQPGFEVAQLMRQGRLGQVQALGGFLQAAAFADGGQRFEVADFQHGAAVAVRMAPSPGGNTAGTPDQGRE